MFWLMHYLGWLHLHQWKYNNHTQHSSARYPTNFLPISRNNHHQSLKRSTIILRKYPHPNLQNHPLSSWNGFIHVQHHWHIWTPTLLSLTISDYNQWRVRDRGVQARLSEWYEIGGYNIEGSLWCTEGQWYDVSVIEYYGLQFHHQGGVQFGATWAHSREQ